MELARDPIKMVEHTHKSTRAERRSSEYEPTGMCFQQSSSVHRPADRLSDRQWAGIATGDESYASADSFSS